MTKEEVERHSHVIKGLLRTIDDLTYEMTNDRHDGWVQDHYRESLTKVRDYLNKVLEQ